jgi:hypothetical protein
MFYYVHIHVYIFVPHQADMQNGSSSRRGMTDNYTIQTFYYPYLSTILPSSNLNK